MSQMHRKIFVHDTVVSPMGQRGVNRSFLAYTEALSNAYPGRVYIYSARPLKIDGSTLLQPTSLGKNLTAIGAQIANLNNLWGGLYADFKSNAYYSPFYGFINTRIPQVFSAYDMIYEKFPEYFLPSASGVAEHIQEKRACLERSALILCISRNTAKDILEIYPHIPQEKVRVVYLGVDDLFFQGDIPPPPKKPFFLFVGNRDKYKNFLRFVRAFGKSGLSRDFDLRLISPTESPFTSDEMETIRYYRLTEHIVVETSIPDIAVRDRYRQAYAFVYPTEYEGFGLPVLEAMSSGTLALASQVASIPEIGADILFYFSPLSEDEMITTLVKAAWLSPTEREQRIARGKARAAHFSWQTSQEKFLQEFGTVLHS